MLNQFTLLDLTFQALSDPTRRAMIERLAHSPASVSDLARPFPMSVPAILQHLGILETAGLITTQKSGRVRTCTLNRATLHLTEQWIATQRAEWHRKFDRLKNYLEELEIKGESNDPSK